MKRYEVTMRHCDCVNSYGMGGEEFEVFVDARDAKAAKRKALRNMRAVKAVEI